MKLKRQMKTKKETSALILIGFLVLAVFIIWGFQLSITFSKDEVDLAEGWQQTQDQIQDSVEYAEQMEGSVEGRSENIGEYFNAMQESVEEQLTPDQLQEIAKMIVAGALKNQDNNEDVENDAQVEVADPVLPQPNEAGWIIVDEITLDEEGNTQIKIQE